MTFMAKIQGENRSYEVEGTVGRVWLRFPLVSEDCMVREPHPSVPDLAAWSCTSSVFHEPIPDLHFRASQNLHFYILLQSK